VMKLRAKQIPDLVLCQLNKRPKLAERGPYELC